MEKMPEVEKFERRVKPWLVTFYARFAGSSERTRHEIEVWEVSAVEAANKVGRAGKLASLEVRVVGVQEVQG